MPTLLGEELASLSPAVRRGAFRAGATTLALLLDR